MNIRTTLEHWLHKQWAKRGWFSFLLRPLSWIALYHINKTARSPRLPLTQPTPPIIIVGNIIVGGAGKTPVVLAICQYLKDQGWQPGLISRGYGVAITGAARVGQGQLDASYFGDEPTLLAQQSGVPIAVHPKRVLALEALRQAYPHIDVIIADDGLQHQALARDIEIIMQDGRGIANGLVLPAGPLREPPSRLKQADWLITQLAPQQSLPHTPKPTTSGRCITMRLSPTYFEQLSTGKKLRASDWLTQHKTDSCAALAAIGQPKRFFAMLEQFGIQLESKTPLPDHAPLGAELFATLKTQQVLITAKDAVKCQSIPDPRIWVVHVAPLFDPKDWLLDLEQQLHRL